MKNHLLAWLETSSRPPRIRSRHLVRASRNAVHPIRRTTYESCFRQTNLINFTCSEALIVAALWSDWNTKVMEGVILFLRDSLEIVGRGSPLAKSAISNKDMDTVWVGGKNKSCSALLTNYVLFSSSSRLEAPRREVRVSIWNTRGRELETQQAQKKKKKNCAPFK